MKIRELRVPPADRPFDPAQHLCGLEFSELSEPVSEADRVGHLEGWHELPRESNALPFRFLVPFSAGLGD